jgi:HEAT repeat protein
MVRTITAILIAMLLVAPALAQEEPEKQEKKEEPAKKPDEKKQPRGIQGHPEWPIPEPDSIEEKIILRIEDLSKLSEPPMRAEQIFTIGELVKAYRAAIRSYVPEYALEKVTEYMKADAFYIVRTKCPEATAKVCDEEAAQVRIKYLQEKTKAGEKPNETPEQVKEALERMRKIARTALLKALKEDAKCDVREQCAGFLPRIAKDKEVVDALIERLLKDGWSKVRAMCVSSLEKIEDPACVPALRQALDKDTYSTVRGPAAAALLRFKDKDAEPLFIKGLKDGWSNVRLICARALGVLGSEKAIEPLTESLTDKYPVVRSEAALSLGKIGDASALPALRKAAGDEDPRVRESVYEAIAEIGKRLGALRQEAADFLVSTGLADKSFGPRLFAVRGLVRLKDERGAKKVVEILQSGQMFEKIDAIQLAVDENLKDAAVLAAIEKIAKSGKKDALDAKKAAEALAKLKK